MRLFGLSFLVALGSCLSACGGRVVVDGASAGGSGGGTATSGSTSSTTTTTGTTCGPTSGGECQTDADCGAGTCAPLTPGGYRVCLDVAPPAAGCTSSMDQCCSSAECPSGGACYSTDVITICKGGPAMPIFNECVADSCQDDAGCLSDMGPRICAPAGAFGYPLRACLPAYCHTDADCTAAPCGACVTVSQTCCSLPAGLACVYPGGCRNDADCGQGNTCVIDMAKGASVCMSGTMPCPV